MRVLAAFPLAFLAFASAGAPAAPSASVPQPAAPSASVPRDGEIRLTAPDHCRSDEPRIANAPGRVGAERLDRLPPGRLDLAVMRQVNGCPEPVTVAENYGVAGTRPTLVKRAERPALPRTRLLDR
jgi:hypothetical protein